MPAHAALNRAFPTREYFRGRAVASALWSLLGSLLLCCTLFTLYLIADLLASGGAVAATGPAGTELASLVTSAETADFVDPAAPGPAAPGPAAPGPGGAGAAAGGAVAPVPEGYRVSYGNAGLLHAAWTNRGGFFGPGLRWLYRAVPALRHDLSALGVLVTVAVILGLLRSLCLSLAKLSAARAASAAATRARKGLHRQALRLGPSDLTDDGPRDVLDLFTDAAEAMRAGIADGVLTLGRHPVKVALLTLLALLVSPLAAVQCALPLLACWFLLRSGRRGVAKARLVAKHRSDRDLRLLAEGLTKSRVVRGYGMEEFESERFNTHLARYQQDLAAANRRERLTRGAGRALLVLCFAVVVFLLGAKVLAGTLTAAQALLLLGVFGCLIDPLTSLADLHRDRHAAAVAAERIYRYLNRVPEVGQAVAAKFLQPLSREMRFENVHYRDARDRVLLDGFSARIPAGSVTAIAALDPLEARALAGLPPRFLEPQRGTVTYDGEDIAWVTLESLRAETVYVGGGDPCFTGTVRENLTGGDPDVPLSRVVEAAKTAHVHNFVQKFPQGYETVLGEHGESLSPGQLFRLGLARAVLRDPAVLIVEEPADGLDEDSKAQLDDTFARVFPGRTVLLLPGRMTTLRRADRVLLLHRGRVEAVGPREELARTSPLYRHWEYLRFNVFRHDGAAVG